MEVTYVFLILSNDIMQVDKEEINQYLIKAHQPKENNINLEII